jgi:hypothetical protein
MHLEIDSNVLPNVDSSSLIFSFSLVARYRCYGLYVLLLSIVYCTTVFACCDCLDPVF